MLVLIGEARIGLHPARIEPRALKRGPKPFPLLSKPRLDASEAIKKNGHPKKQQ
ncbi:MAG: hypothetical protein WA970_00975 [Gammaproteobacteria bacterium]